MPERRYNLSERDRRKLQKIIRKVDAGNGSSRPTPTRRRPMGGGSSGRVIYAQVNEASGVSSGDTSFSFDNAVAIVGSIPSGGTGTGQNQYAQTFANNDWTLLFQEKDTEQWLTERGGESGSQVVYFELTQDMAYADTAKLAKPVQDDGTLDTGASAFYVVDDRAIAGDGQYYGKAAYTDGDTEAASYAGYRGHAVRFIDDWNSTGVPGFRIVDMEGPRDFILVVLKEDVASDVAECDVVASNDPAGGPDADRKPRIEDTDYHITVNDDLEIAANAKDGETWVAKWDRGAAYYIFWRPVDAFGNVIYAQVNEASGVGTGDATFSFDNATAIVGTAPAGGTGTAQNQYGQVYTNNAWVLLFQVKSSGQWLTENFGLFGLQVISAKVNEGSGVAATATTFAFDNGADLIGSSGVTSGTASNLFANCYIDNEDILLVRINDASWVTLKQKRYVRVSGVTGSTVAASTTSFSAGTVKAIQGDLPPLSSGNITVYNVAKIPIANGATAEFRWNEETDHWETEPLKAHTVFGLATSAVSGSSSFTIDTIELVHGSDPRSDPTSSSETLTVSNPFSFTIDNNGLVLATKAASGTWHAIQAECP